MWNQILTIRIPLGYFVLFRTDLGFNEWELIYIPFVGFFGGVFVAMKLTLLWPKIANSKPLNQGDFMSKY